MGAPPGPSPRSATATVEPRLSGHPPLSDQAPVVPKVDSTIHWINYYPKDSAIGFRKTYPLDSDLSSGWRYPTFEQPGPVIKVPK